MSKPNIQVWPIDRLTPYDKNVKIHDKDQVAKIAQSIKQFGWTQPIVVDKDGSIIAGHGRRLAAISLNMDKVPVLVRDDLSEEAVKALRLADNRVALGSFDTEMMREELAELNFDMAGIFDTKELDFSMADLGQMNPDVFVMDVDAAVNEQENQAKIKTEEIAARRVPLTKVFGFKDIAGAAEIHMNRFLAFIESKTGKTGEEALVAYAQTAIAA